MSNVQRWGFTYNSDFENLRLFKPSQSWGRSLGPQLPNTRPPHARPVLSGPFLAALWDPVHDVGQE